jgi:hypothetical protein
VSSIIALLVDKIVLVHLAVHRYRLRHHLGLLALQHPPPGRPEIDLLAPTVCRV